MNSDNKKKISAVHYGLHNMKKFELHMHLQGAITIQVFQYLYTKNKEEVYKHIYSDARIKERFLKATNIANFMEKDKVDEKTIEELFTYRNISDFFSTYRFINLFIKTIQDFDILVKGVIDELIRQNVVYADIVVSLPELLEQGFSIQQIVNVLNKNVKNFKVKINWWIDLVRSKNKIQVIKLLDEIIEKNVNRTIFGIHIGGDETVCDITTYDEVINRAINNGFQVEVHDGETTEVNNMSWYLKTQISRITHGISYLNKCDKIGIPIEVCISSNKCTNLIEDVYNHPVMRNVRHIKKICICTDDPTLFKTDLINELMYIYNKYQLDGLKTVMRNSIQYSYLTQDRKREYYEVFNKEWKQYFGQKMGHWMGICK